jgi:epoxyqueuosine reductase QueG
MMLSREIDSTGRSGVSNAELKTQLQAFAREAGFDSCGVATCAPPPHANEFRDWLQDGAAGEMSYMERGEENVAIRRRFCRARDL